MTPFLSFLAGSFQKCDSGFIADDLNGWCYTALNDASDFYDASEVKCPKLDAELVNFENAQQIERLLYLFGNGNLLFFLLKMRFLKAMLRIFHKF